MNATIQSAIYFNNLIYYNVDVFEMNASTVWVPASVSCNKSFSHKNLGASDEVWAYSISPP